MFIAINRLKVKQGHGEELQERFSQAGGGVQRQEGFLGFDLLKRVWAHHDEDAEEFLVVTRWNSREEHEVWIQSEAFKKAHAGPRMEALISGEPGGYEICFTKEPNRGDSLEAHKGANAGAGPRNS